MKYMQRASGITVWKEYKESAALILLSRISMIVIRSSVSGGNEHVYLLHTVPQRDIRVDMKKAASLYTLLMHGGQQ